MQTPIAIFVHEGCLPLDGIVFDFLSDAFNPNRSSMLVNMFLFVSKMRQFYEYTD